LPSIEQFRELVGKLEDSFKNFPVIRENIWHTVMRSYKFLGDDLRAREAAKTILDIRQNMTFQEMSPYFLEAHELIGKDAWKIFKDS
jgi:hypothetical protein